MLIEDLSIVDATYKLCHLEQNIKCRSNSAGHAPSVERMDGDILGWNKQHLQLFMCHLVCFSEHVSTKVELVF